MSEDKLSSWKEIAAYLKCEESTARRWERKSGLPIHRVEKGGLVYAYRQEIDDWLKRQSTALAAEQQSTDSAANLESTMDSSPEATFPVPVLSAPGAPLVTSSPRNGSAKRPGAHWKYYLLVALVLVLVAVTSAFLYASRYRRFAASAASTVGSKELALDSFYEPVPESTATELKKTVKDAQIWEALTLYAAPWTCDAHDLERYWEPGSKAFIDVGESASRLNERGWHYGSGARLLDFEFRYVRLSQDGLSAEVGTREHWFLPLYTRDEKSLSIRNPDQGPYEIDYLLTKIGDRWYLRSENTPYSQWKPHHITCNNWPQQ